MVSFSYNRKLLGLMCGLAVINSQSGFSMWSDENQGASTRYSSASSMPVARTDEEEQKQLELALALSRSETNSGDFPVGVRLSTATLTIPSAYQEQVNRKIEALNPSNQANVLNTFRTGKTDSKFLSLKTT